MAARLRGEHPVVPAHWSAEMTEAFEHGLLDEDFRSALLACAIRGWQRRARAGDTVN